MADLYLERIGLARPTIVERDNNGEIERLESIGLDIASLVAFWRRCFDLDGLLFEKITLHCKSKDFNAMGGRTLAACHSVRELLAEQGVECVIDDEWFKNREVKNEEVEQADRVLTNACNKFAKESRIKSNTILGRARTLNGDYYKALFEYKHYQKDGKQFCPHGHEYTEKNSGYTSQGYRYCKVCMQKRREQYNKKRKEKRRCQKQS